MNDVPHGGAGRNAAVSFGPIQPYGVEGSVDRIDFSNQWVGEVQPGRGWLDAVRGRRLVGIAAPKGTGKTQALRAWAARMFERHLDAQLTVLTHRIALGDRLAEDFGGAFYRDHMGKSSRGVARTAKCLVVSAQSLGKFADRVFEDNIVVIDEAKQVFRAVATPGEDNGIPRDKRNQILANVLAVIRRAKRTYLLDADLSAELTALIGELAGVPREDCLHVRNLYVPERGTAHELPTREALYEDLRSTASIGESCLAMSTSRAEAERVDQRLRSEGYRTLLITGTTRDGEAVKAFLADPNAEMSEVDVVIASPVIGTGVSLEGPDGSGPLFQHVFLDGVTNRMHIEDLLQMVARVRGNPDVHFHVPWPDTGTEKEPVPSPEQIAEFTERSWRGAGKKIAQQPNHVQDARAYAPDRFRQLLRLHGFLEHDRRVTLREARHEIVRRMGADGYTVVACERGEHTKDQKRARDAAFKNHREAKVSALAEVLSKPGGACSGEDGVQADKARWLLGMEKDEVLGEDQRHLAELALDHREDILNAELVATAEGFWRALAIDRTDHGYVRREESVFGETDEETGIAEALFTHEEHRQLVNRTVTPLDARYAMFRAKLITMLLAAAGTNPAEVFAGQYSFRSEDLAGAFLATARNYRLALKKYLDIDVNVKGEARPVSPMKTLLRRICVGAEKEKDGKQVVWIAVPHPALAEVLARRATRRDGRKTDPIGTKDRRA
jgi:hypothetical protein